ncbi:NAD(+) diphosphatase [Marinoscillum sp.]|uniref:NAD(+) diphosphatase n=1 Tax=Marinoscillum sp. TaxID=2024838 RepID=UPI003BAA2E13
MEAQIYSNHSLDRATLHRESDEFALCTSRKYIPVWKGQFFFENHKNGIRVKAHVSVDKVGDSSDAIFLGIDEDTEWYCRDVSHWSLSSSEKKQLKDLRKVFSWLDPKEASLLAYARGILQWHSTHLFCGKCGSHTVSQMKGHSRACTNNYCEQLIYPRIDPSIITLIEYKGNEEAMCLLNRRKLRNGYICSTLAGFVEIGESLEDAVVREMKEEVNVSVENIRYMGSQPWPFPASLMVGFFAETRNLDYKIDQKEIKDVKWYTADEIENEVKQGKLILSKGDSIARTLIKNWIAENRSAPVCA